MWQHSADLPDEFFSALHEMCKRLDCRADDMASCWMSESNVSPRAHNPGGNASGLFQAMPGTLMGLGYMGHWDDFVKLSAVEQLAWAERYYARHRGQLTSPGACYLATFLPALMSHASESAFVLCASHGPFAYAYAGNHAAFDPEGKGWITVQDLTDRIGRVAVGPRWQEIVDRLRQAAQGADTDPERVPIDIGDDGMPDLTTVQGQQEGLNRCGHNCTVDGVYGSQTRAACVGFQGDRGLKCDGVFGPVTQAEMRRALMQDRPTQPEVV